MAQDKKTPSGLVNDGKRLRCIKCNAPSGDNWTQCHGVCPVKCSPHYAPDWRPAKELENLKEIARMAKGYTDQGRPIPMEIQPLLVDLLIELIDAQNPTDPGRG